MFGERLEEARRAGTRRRFISGAGDGTAVQNGVMPSWRPDEASDPDGENERRFAPLAESDPDLADSLLDRYGRRWLRAAHLPEGRLPEVPDTVELLVAPDWTEPPDLGRKTLRLRSWYTGSTYWLSGWDGSRADVERWIDDMADLQAGNVDGDRQYGPTKWDDPARWSPPVRPPRPPGFHGIVEDQDPGRSSVQLVAQFEFAREPVADDIPLAVERLAQSREVPPEVAAAARVRAESTPSPRAFFEWLAATLTPRATDPEPIDCDCGAALIDPSDFSGRATVRCGRCGARWGIEVENSDSWSRWSLDVPSAGESS